MRLQSSYLIIIFMIAMIAAISNAPVIITAGDSCGFGNCLTYSRAINDATATQYSVASSEKNSE